MTSSLSREAMDSMDSLIRKLEEATGPSRELDCRIEAALFPDKEVMLDPGVAFGPGPKAPAVRGPLSKVPLDGWADYESLARHIGAGEYTRSFDAAMRTVRPGWELYLWMGRDSQGARLRRNVGGTITETPPCTSKAGAVVAIIIASLKAIQSSKNSDTGRKQT